MKLLLKFRCPWHHEQTPSLHIRRSEGGDLEIYCFGCGRHATAREFIDAMTLTGRAGEALAAIGQHMDALQAELARLQQQINGQI